MTEINEPEAVAAISAAAGKTGAASTGASILGILVSNEFIAVSGLLIALISFIVNVWYRRKEHLMRVREHELRMKHLSGTNAYADDDDGP